MKKSSKSVLSGQGISRSSFHYEKLTLVVVMILVQFLAQFTVQGKEFDSKWIQRLGFDIGDVTEHYLQTIHADPDSNKYYLYQYARIQGPSSTTDWVSYSDISVDTPSVSAMFVQKKLETANVNPPQAMAHFDNRKTVVLASNYASGSSIATEGAKITV